VFFSVPRYICNLILTISISLLSSPVFALELKGIANYQALGKSYYIASLYVDDITQDLSEQLAQNKPQKMVIKVTAKRWSSRKWKAQWQDNIAINNTADDELQLTRAIAIFTEFPMGSLRLGDEIVIEYTAALGTNIYFNSHHIITTNSPKLFQHLVNTWVGKYPPDRIFRDQIEGAVAPDSELLAQLDQPVSEKRIAQVATWFITEEQKQAAQRLKEQLIAEELRKLEQAETERQARILASQTLKEELIKKQQLVSEPKSLSLQQDLAMQDYYQELYLWLLQDKINESVVYPPWAKQFSYEGPVELSFATDSDARLLNVVNKTPETSLILSQEVGRRLQLALEVVTRPPELRGERWSFTVKYEFDPAVEKAAISSPQPVKPSF
jgi:hypothetical protein